MQRPTTVISMTTIAVCLAAFAYAQSSQQACTETDGPTRALGLFKPGEAVALEEGFRDPPAISRLQCWWQCHGSAFTKAE